jgi:hypothetical protein
MTSTAATASITAHTVARVAELAPRFASAAELDAARLLLARLGVDPADLIAIPTVRVVPTFADYVPMVSAAVSVSSRKGLLVVLEQDPRRVESAPVGPGEPDRYRTAW